jgi:hypothetical protein
MVRECKFFIAAVLSAVVWPAGAQPPAFVTLEIAWENSVSYTDVLADPSKLATSSSMVSSLPNLRNFMSFIQVGDIVSINSKPARGSWAATGRYVFLGRNPTPSQAIGDINRAALIDIHLEILQPDGTPVGTIMSAGLGGGAGPPGAPQGFFGNHTVTGGTGVFVGAKGMLTYQAAHRPASTEEDPSNRRTHGGGRGVYSVYLIPMYRPEIITTPSGPSVFHADFSPVSSARPARRGETLIAMVSGLGPTRPGVRPGTSFLADPLEEVNSPVEVTMNGTSGEVLNKVGWPGTTDTYRIDFRVPDDTTAGMATIQLTTAFIPARQVTIPVQ